MSQWSGEVAEVSVIRSFVNDGIVEVAVYWPEDEPPVCLIAREVFLHLLTDACKARGHPLVINP